MRVTKRTFLKTIGSSAPTLTMMFQGASTQAAAADGKFTPIDCTAYFTAIPADFSEWQTSRDKPLRTPSGERTLRGIPFEFAPEGSKCWFLLTRRPESRGSASAEIPISHKGRFVCLAHFCDRDENETAPADIDAFEKVGQHLADAVLSYDDGGTHRHPIRRRFEVNSLSYPWGHQCFAAVPHDEARAAKLTEPLSNAMHWGEIQTGIWSDNYVGKDDGVSGTLWICALENPFPERTIRSLRLDAVTDSGALAVCAVTLYHGRETPLRRDRLSLFRITLPAGETQGPWEVRTDLGVVARSYQLPAFEAEKWLSSPSAGLGGPRNPVVPNYLYVEAAVNRNATLTLHNTRSGTRFEFDLKDAGDDREIEGRPGGPRVHEIERHKVWLHGKVVDGSSGRPTPVRLAFRSADGRYIPPYGHRTEINSAWFQDYGADLRIQDSSFAYVDGTFQIELPVGEVYLEMSKGFEYEPVRKKLQIQPHQRELNLEISRFANLRAENWASADTHVHFLSPSTAILEGQAEGLNLINLLAAQWGDLFTNVGDLSNTPLTSNDGEMVVWVGTENRQHLLGHLALLGGIGDPVFPMSASGPEESYIGDPLWNSLAEWTDACRKRKGLVVAVHFPYPTAELAADIALGKIDAVELAPTAMSEQFNTLRFLDWYRYLNCGYRLPAVSGTDKMGAWIAAGAYRAYAYLGQHEFTFPNWAKAVRAGNTFMTSGPLLFFQVDGRVPGSEVAIGANGGKLEARAEVRSTIPVHRLEIVMNGKVVASREDKTGSREMVLHESISVPGPGWLAARCASRIVSAGVRVAAHTSPVYIAIPGRDLFSAPVATYMLTLIDGAETWAKTLATRPDAERFARTLKVFSDAREKLHRRMHEHGIPH
jgi:hypothetical protein